MVGAMGVGLVEGCINEGGVWRGLEGLGLLLGILLGRQTQTHDIGRGWNLLANS